MDRGDIRELAVGDIMHTEWPTLGPDDTVEAAIKLFAERNISGAPVVEGETLSGIVTEGDLIFRDVEEVKGPGFLDILGGMIPLGDWEEYRRETLKSTGVTVGQVMTGEVKTISPQAPLSEAATIMAEEKIRLLPVAEEGNLRGVLTRMDILTLHILDPSL